MADDKDRAYEVEGHLKTRSVEERAALEPEDKFKAGRKGLSEDEEPEVEGHILKAAQPEKKYKKA